MKTDHEPEDSFCWSDAQEDDQPQVWRANRVWAMLLDSLSPKMCDDCWSAAKSPTSFSARL